MSRPPKRTKIAMLPLLPREIRRARTSQIRRRLHGSLAYDGRFSCAEIAFVLGGWIATGLESAGNAMA